jgi:EpsI family protein
MITIKRRLLVLSALFVVCWAALHAAGREGTLPPREALRTLPVEVAGWRSTSDAPLDPKVLAVLGADDYVNRVYSNRDGRQASLYVGYYTSQRQGDSIHSPLNCLPGAGWQPIRQTRLALPAPGSSSMERPAFVVNDVVVQKGEDRQLVLYWYQSQGRVIASEYSAKALLFIDAVRSGRTDAALVRIVTPVDRQDEDGDGDATRVALDFAGGLLSVLGRYLPE